ncbi:MAG: YraN family protein [Bacteroidales bacterium]|nr:YraN family protein [Bacteroidales bacterium]
MAEHNITGAQGETMARQYLQEKGYAIVATNWRVGKMEVDIIARLEQLLVFVEVKTRHLSPFGSPEEAVDRRKRQMYVKAANSYVLQHQCEEEVRFDIIAITLSDNGYDIRHYPDAFNAVGLYLR